MFARLAGIYGNRLGHVWDGTDLPTVKRIWSIGLAGYTPEEIAAGLRACLDREWPPTLPDFRHLCRPGPNYRALFELAQLGKRTDPLAYWAGVRFGAWDLRGATWATAEHRWRDCVDAVIAAGPIPPVPPEGQLALPRPGATRGSDVARRAIDRIRGILEGGHRI